jgi:transposase
VIAWPDDVLVAKGYRPVVRDQPFLFPPDMRDWVPADHPVWTVMAIVNRLDTSAFHQKRRVGGVGRPGYDPDMLVTLLIWAWLQGVRSSRRIERACADVVPYRLICAGDGPDHATIARFRQDNHHACRQLFTQVLMLAAQLGLGRLETVARDGVKIASNASLAAIRTASGLARAAETEAARIAEAAIAEHAAADADEDAVYGPDNPGLVPAELADPASLAARIDEAKARLHAGDAADSDDPASPDDRTPPPAHIAESTETVEPEAVPRDRSARITRAQAGIAAEIAAERAERCAMVGQYVARIEAGEKIETPWFCRRLGLLDSGQGLVGPWVIVEEGFEFCGWDVSEVAVEAGGVVPVHPSEGGQLDVLDGLPRPDAGRSVDQLGLVVAVDGLGESVVIRLTG